MTLGVGLRGRPFLNIVVPEFDLDNALGGVISGVDLFQIASPEGDYQSLVHFRDGVQYVLSQLPLDERLSEQMLSRWLYERLKKIRSCSIVIDRIGQTPAGSPERTFFEYLWSRLNRYIAECQHDKNLSSVQGDLRKGPTTKKTGAAAKAAPKAEASQTSGAVAQGKGKGKSKGKGKGKNQGAKSADSKNPPSNNAVSSSSNSQADGKKQ